MKHLITTSLLITFFLVAGCKTLDMITEGAAIAAGAAGMDGDKVRSAGKVIKAGAEAVKEITPEQEYYIGRAVGATILKTYKPYDNSKANRYLNVLGKTLSSYSDMPETFAGYHFLILDTSEINAFAAPGGFIFVSRGLLRCCKSEDAFAAVLAHEIGHVQSQHGLQAIKKSRVTTAVTTTVAEGAKSFGGEQLAQLTTAFEGSISDIASTMVNSGYARKFETQADLAAVTIMKRVGYNPNGLKEMLLVMETHLKSDKRGFASTHPDPKVRIKDIEAVLDGGAIPMNSPRQVRFKKAMEGV